MSPRVTTSILIKARVPLPSATLSLGAAGTPFTVTPLFKSIGQASRPRAAAPGKWYRLSAESDVVEPNPWDLCHDLMQRGLGVAGGAPEFAEPDLQQRWIVGDDASIALGLAAECGNADKQDPQFPGINDDPYWFRKPDHSQFDAALAAIGGPDVSPKVRIAHLDTGYDPSHETKPKQVRNDLERDFVDGGNSAADDSEGVLTNIGHGTGTLSLLAGAGIPILGGALFAEIVPIRVANRVVLFYNSAIAQALDYVHSLHGDPKKKIDVVTMSMGGLPSYAWADAVNALYDQGVFIVTAAGNNFGNLPTREIVWPARFGRVVAACGIMSDHKPYADLGIGRMAGNYGPEEKMATAIAACTPNVPWARFGCAELVDFDGAGTSAATPQVAAAAAIWIQHNREALDAYPKGWMRVESIRRALFDSAQKNSHDQRWLGQGELRTNDALGQMPAAAARLKQQGPDSTSFPLIHALIGMGPGAAPDGQQRMLELEALQLSQSPAVQRVLDEVGATKGPLTPPQERRLAEALAAEPGASKALRHALRVEPRVATRSFVPDTQHFPAMERMHLDHAINPPIPKPSSRPLRVYAYDPSLEGDLATLSINVATLDVRWEPNLLPGPVGEYLEVIDVDPSSRCCYAPVDLNDPNIIIRDGLPPSEANPQFHQQMVYAVAMNTIEHFERALGRAALWAPQQIRNEKGEVTTEHYVQRLRIYPHALRTQNAYYSPERKALLLGYFTAQAAGTGDVLPRGTVFTAVSHDIVAHETTHALLDGLHRRFLEPTNDDVLAFHEAFADIVALFQHFTIPEALRHEIARTRGDLRSQNLLMKLAVQFGHATGRFGALRDEIGEIKQGDNGEPRWEPQKPSTSDYINATEAHERGSVLVAAVFDAFLQLYAQHAGQLIRLATGGRGVLEAGEIPVALADSLAEAASKIAGRVLGICIRALDYCPPVDITFGDYLRALITADTDLVPSDVRGYRTAFIAAFRARGIYPSNVRHLSQGSLVWEPPPLPLKNVGSILSKLTLSWDLKIGRKQAYEDSRVNARTMQKWLCDRDQVDDDEFRALGFSRDTGAKTIDKLPGNLHRIEVHSVRPARRIGPDGQSRSQLVIEITQSFWPDDKTMVHFRGGCTLLVDLEKNEVSYFVRKKLDVERSLKEQQRLAIAIPLHANYFDTANRIREPLAMLHQVYG